MPPTVVERTKAGYRIVLPGHSSAHVNVNGQGETATAICADTLTWADLRRLRAQLADLNYTAVRLDLLVEL